MIIGLVGFMSSGKGTCADYLVREHGFLKESFANSVKDSVSVVFGWDRQLLEGDTDYSRGWRERADPWWSNKLGREFSPRSALQLMGTEAGRDVFDENIWVYSMFRRMDHSKNYVIADVRFPNEIQKIKEEGGMVIRVKKGPDPIWYLPALDVNTKRDLYVMAENFPQVHYSEWAWIGSEGIDYTINNDGSIEDLENEIEKLLPLCGLS
jgi:hypothetical protein